jgi:hypothetical protein
MGSEDGVCRKLATFTLKRYLSFVQRTQKDSKMNLEVMEHTSQESEDAATPLQHSSLFGVLEETGPFWENYFLVYEGVQETGVHLIDVKLFACLSLRC